MNLMSILRFALCVLTAGSALATTLCAQTVHVISNGSGSALQTAIDTAGDGDTILLHSGSFANVHMGDKSLTLVSEPAHSTTIRQLDLTGLSAGRRVVISGLRLLTSDALLAFGTILFPTPALKLTACSGSVRVQDTQCVGFVPDSGANAVIVSQSTDVAFFGCQIFGGHKRSTNFSVNGASYFGPGYGLGTSTGSRVALYDSELRGGNGSNAALRGSFGGSTIFPATTGTVGIVIQTGNAFVANSLVLGGKGGNGLGTSCSTACGNDSTPGANGGDGLQSLSAQVLIVGNVVMGGLPGIGGTGATCSGGACFPPGVTHPSAPSGMPGSASSGPQVVLPGPAASLSAPVIARESQTLAVTVTGTPGETALLAVSTDSRWIESVALQGVLLFGPDVRRLDLGVLPPSGSLSITFAIGSLPAGVETAARILQVATRDAAGTLRLGGARAITIVGQGF